MDAATEKNQLLASTALRRRNFRLLKSGKKKTFFSSKICNFFNFNSPNLFFEFYFLSFLVRLRFPSPPRISFPKD